MIEYPFKQIEALCKQIKELPQAQQENMMVIVDQLVTSLQELQQDHQLLVVELKDSVTLQKTNLRLQQEIIQQLGQIQELEKQLQREKIKQKTANQSLSKSEAKLQSILRHSSDVVTIIDANGRIMYHSPTFEKILGYKTDDRLGGHFVELLHKDDVALVKEYLTNVLQKGEDKVMPTIEYRAKHLNGKWVYMESIATNLLNDPNVSGIVLNSRNITERKEHQNQTQKYYQIIINTLESISDAFFALDDNWQFTYVNKQAEIILKRSRHELLGKNIWEELPQAKEMNFFSNCQQALEDSISIAFIDYYPPLKAWLQVHIYPSENGLSIYFVDITKQQEQQNEIRKTNQILRSLIQASPLPIISMDTKMNITHWNPAAEKLFGWHEAEIIGKTLPTIPETEMDDFQEMLKAELKGATHAGKQVRRLRKDGSIIDVCVWTAPLYNGGNKVIGSIRIYSDIEMPFWVRYLRPPKRSVVS